MPIAHGPSSTPTPAIEVSLIGPEWARINVPRFDVFCPIQAEGRLNANVNPQIAASVNSPYSTAGCSNIVTPIPHYVPRLFNIEWLIGAAAIIKALLDPGDKMKQKSDIFVEQVQQTIDMNSFLPTSYDSMEEWRTVSGSVTQAVR